LRALTNNRESIQSSGIIIEDFLSMLDKVTKSGKNWMARCPAHEDGRPSLRVAVGDRGILVNCYAGCSYDEIIGSLGLRPSDLFFDALDSRTRAFYRYRAVRDRLMRLDVYCAIYQAEMDKGLLTDEDRKRFQDHIANRNQALSEAAELRREYGFEDSDL